MRPKYNIAIITGRVNEYDSELIRGIIDQGHRLDCNLCVFAVFSEYEQETEHQNGEEKIYDEIDFDLFDGVILADAAIWSDRMRKKIIRLIKQKCHIPVLRACSDPSDNVGFRNFCMSSRQHFGEIVEHLIMQHGYSRIYCLTGTKGNYTSDERLAGYIETMKKHGLSPDNSYIFEGDFWTDAARKLGTDIALRKVERPQAVVCVNDASAVSLINTLSECGIKVPEDIAVTGFDAMTDSMLSNPSVTTYAYPNVCTGQKCLTRLYNMIGPLRADEPEIGPGELIINRSCGCTAHENSFMKRAKNLLVSKQKYAEKFETSNINERLMSACDINSFTGNVDSLTYLIEGYKRYCLCLCRENSTGKMTMLIDKRENGQVLLFRDFYKKDMIKALFEPGPESGCCFITPLHFNNDFFGFSAIEYSRDFLCMCDVYKLWNKTISSALFYLSRNKGMESVFDKSSGLPEWMDNVITQMNKPENYIPGLPRLLETAHMSQEHITREFRKYLNVTPTEFINSRRILYAADLVLEGKKSITEICFASGFNNVGYFYRKFRSQLGCSPKKYSDKNKK